MKFIHLPLIIILAVYSSSNSADAYAGFKYEIPYNSMYIEAGAMTGGTGIEMGYKFTKGNWLVKGKFEGTDTTQRDYFKSKIETEVIYKFGK